MVVYVDERVADKLLSKALARCDSQITFNANERAKLSKKEKGRD